MPVSNLGHRLCPRPENFPKSRVSFGALSFPLNQRQLRSRGGERYGRDNRHPERYDEKQFPLFLDFMASHYGGISAMALRFGIDASNLNKAIKGKLPPSRKLLKLLGVTQKRVYEIPLVKDYPK